MVSLKNSSVTKRFSENAERIGVVSGAKLVPAKLEAILQYLQDFSLVRDLLDFERSKTQIQIPDLRQADVETTNPCSPLPNSGSSANKVQLQCRLVKERLPPRMRSQLVMLLGDHPSNQSFQEITCVVTR